jgi:hypothetical protein
MKKKPIAFPALAWIAVSPLGYFAPFLGVGLTRKALKQRAHAVRPGFEKAGYRLIKVSISEYLE